MVITPRDFGAVDGTDSTAALQAFLDHIYTTNVGTAASLEGNYKVSAGLTFGTMASNGQSATQSVAGDLTLQAVAPIDTMFKMCGVTDLRHTGSITLKGTGSTNYAGRTCRIGLQVTGRAARLHLASVTAEAFLQDGINLYGDLPGSISYLTRIDRVTVALCGTGVDLNGFSSTTTWANPTNYGGAASGGQGTTLTVGTTPPPADVAGAQFVIINGSLYQIDAVNAAAGTINIYPWLDPTIAAAGTGTLRYQYGAGVRINGSDAASVLIDQIDARTCGIGLYTSAMYGPIVRRLITQYCGTATVIGGRRDGAMVSTDITGLYCEGNTYDVVMNAAAVTATGVRINGYAINPAKCWNITPGRYLHNGRIANSHPQFKNVNINFGDGERQAEKAPENYAQTYVDIDPTDRHRHLTYRINSAGIRIQPPSLDRNRLFGHDSMELTLIGTAPSGAPTSFTVTPPTGYTVNGQQSITYNGFTGPVSYLVFLDIAAKNYLIYQSRTWTV